MSGEPNVYRARVVPHWFQNNTRFWSRNDLRGAAREFIVVDAERGTRQPAFDHEAVARQMGGGASGSQLPVEQLRFSDDGQFAERLLGRTNSWLLEIKSGTLKVVANDKATYDGLPAEAAEAITADAGR